MRSLCSRTMLTVLGALASSSPEAAAIAPWSIGNAPTPQAETRVALLAQEIELRRVAPGGYQVAGGGHWQVTARHQLSNLTDGPVRLRIGVAEPSCPDDLDCSILPFNEMRASLRGMPVATEAVPTGDGRAQAHLLTAELAAGETVELAHSYRHGVSERPNGGEDLAQPARLAALWAGPVDEASWRVVLPFRPWGLTLGGWEDVLAGLEERIDAGAAQVTMRFVSTGREPETDLQLYIGPGRPTLASPALLPHCPAPADLFGSAINAGDPDASANSDQLSEVSSETLRHCRNAVYAHHGYDFADPAIDAAFYGVGELRIVAPLPGTGVPGAVFARNPDFTPALLSPEERAYVAAIRRLEDSR